VTNGIVRVVEGIGIGAFRGHVAVAPPRRRQRRTEHGRSEDVTASGPSSPVELET
jgi:hypothetical protein